MYSNQGLYIGTLIDRIRFMFYNMNIKNPLVFSGDTPYSSTDIQRKAITNQEAKKILNDYGKSILRLAYSYLHNMSDAEDILQDTLIQYIKSAPCFQSEAHQKAWLLKVASNLSKNKISYNKIRQTDELSELLQAEEGEDLSFVWDAMKMLPIKHREVIHLFYYEGYSTTEIAKILNKNESTIRSSLHRGRKSLKQILEEVYDFE